ncbi:MAG: hypothetical protein R3E01_29960 [Pirellulaceae bacterium]
MHRTASSVIAIRISPGEPVHISQAVSQLLTTYQTDSETTHDASLRQQGPRWGSVDWDPLDAVMNGRTLYRRTRDLLDG